MSVVPSLVTVNGLFVYLRGDGTYPTTQTNVDLTVQALHFANLDIEGFDPRQHTRTFLLHLRMGVGVVGLDPQTLQDGSHLLSTTAVKVFQIVQGGQSLREIDLIEGGSKATTQEAGDKAGRQRAGLGGHARDLLRQLGPQLSGRVGRDVLSRRDGRIGGAGRGSVGKRRVGNSRAWSGMFGRVGVQGVHGAQRDLIGTRVTKTVVKDPSQG